MVFSSFLYSHYLILVVAIKQGFDEYMNVVLEEASEINLKTSSTREIGRILLKGDCITLIQRANPLEGSSS
jgi:small nuclear ribonucleoprotein E